MKFSNAISNLKEMNFIDDNNKIRIAVYRGKKHNPEDKLFDTDFPVELAENFFGDMEVINSKIITEGERNIPKFFFLLAYEKEVKKEEE